MSAYLDGCKCDNIYTFLSTNLNECWCLSLFFTGGKISRKMSEHKNWVYHDVASFKLNL
jgi:hypothetical protein